MRSKGFEKEESLVFECGFKKKKVVKGKKGHGKKLLKFKKCKKEE